MGATVINRNGQTFRLRRRCAEHGLPGGYELCAAGLEAGVAWSFLSLWPSRKAAVEAAECFAPNLT
jgi:hypothetical protein